MLIRLPRWLSGKESTCQCRRYKFDPWIMKIPWRRKWQPAPVFLPGKFHGEEPGRLQPMGSQSWTWLSTHTHKANSQLHSRAAPPQLVLEDAGGCGLDPFHLSRKLQPTWFLMTLPESRESIMRQPELLWTPGTVAEILAASNFRDSSCRAIIGVLQTTPPIFNDYLGFPGVSQSRIIKVLLWEIVCHPKPQHLFLPS